jgi:hypothetical protein
VSILPDTMSEPTLTAAEPSGPTTGSRVILLAILIEPADMQLTPVKSEVPPSTRAPTFAVAVIVP